MKYLSILLCIGHLAICMEDISSIPHQKESLIPISKKTITEYKNEKFKKLVQRRNAQTSYLNTPFIGTIGSWVIETFKGANAQQVKAFLSRTFSNEPKLQEIINKIEDDEDNITYLQNVFSKMDTDSLLKKDQNALIHAMRACRHPKVPDPDSMYEKENGRYKLSDDSFLNYAASNLLASHILESYSPPSSPKKSRRSNFHH